MVESFVTGDSVVNETCSEVGATVALLEIAEETTADSPVDGTVLAGIVEEVLTDALEGVGEGL